MEAYKLGFKPADEYEAEDALFFWKMKKASLDSFIRRIDPYDEELLSMTIGDLMEAKEEIERLRNIIWKLKEPINWVRQP